MQISLKQLQEEVKEQLGGAGIAVQDTEPTEENVKLWVIPSYEREVEIEVPVEGSETGETTTETYIETVPAAILYKDADGTFRNMDSIAGAPGAAGEDGFSPTVTLEDLTNDNGQKIGVTLSITDKDSTQSTNILNGTKGDKGDSGRGVVDIVNTGSAGNVDTYTINFTDGTNTTFTVTNGKENERTSQLENDSGFITKLVSDLVNYYTKDETLSTEEITALIEQKANGERVIVDGDDEGRPSIEDPADINLANTYLVKTTNGYSMWAYIGGTWARLGDTDINLSGYYTMGQTDAKFATKTELESCLKEGDFATVAKTGSYNDLTDKPIIPNTDGFATTAQIDDKVQAAQTEIEAKIPNADDFRKKTDTIQYSEISGTPSIDTALSATSENAVQNKVIAAAIEKLQYYQAGETIDCNSCSFAAYLTNNSSDLHIFIPLPRDVTKRTVILNTPWQFAVRGTLGGGTYMMPSADAHSYLHGQFTSDKCSNFVVATVNKRKAGIELLFHSTTKWYINKTTLQTNNTPVSVEAITLSFKVT